MAKEPKLPTSLKLDRTTREQMTKLATEQGESEATIVEKAVAAYFSTTPTLSRRIDTVYQTVSDQIQALEITRDYERELTPEEAAFHTWLYGAWDGLRRLAGFWEPRFQENESGTDYVYGPDGPVVDADHEATRPRDL